MREEGAARVQGADARRVRELPRAGRREGARRHESLREVQARRLQRPGALQAAELPAVALAERLARGLLREVPGRRALVGHLPQLLARRPHLHGAADHLPHVRGAPSSPQRSTPPAAERSRRPQELEKAALTQQVARAARVNSNASGSTLSGIGEGGPLRLSHGDGGTNPMWPSASSSRADSSLNSSRRADTGHAHLRHRSPATSAFTLLCSFPIAAPDRVVDLAELPDPRWRSENPDSNQGSGDGQLAPIASVDTPPS